MWPKISIRDGQIYSRDVRLNLVTIQQEQNQYVPISGEALKLKGLNQGLGFGVTQL